MIYTIFDGKCSKWTGATRSLPCLTRQIIATTATTRMVMYVAQKKVQRISGFTTPDIVNDLLEDAKKEAQQWFNKIEEQINNEVNNNNNIQLQTEVIVTATSIVSAIVEYAKNRNVDLIVTGTRGRSQFKKLLLGSVASGVITDAACPVMVVK